MSELLGEPMSKPLKKENIQLLINDKFKDVHFSIRFMTDISEPQITMRNLLSYVMTDRNEAYPSKQSINLKTDDLFALSFNVKTTAYGIKHILEMRFTTLSERYSKEPHLQESLEFIETCIRRPLINEETLTEAKQNMRSNLRRIMDKPNTLATLKALELGGPNEPISLFSQGREDLIDSISVESLKTYHQQMLKEDDVFVIGLGQIDPHYFNFLEKIYLRPRSFENCSYSVREKPYQSDELTKDIKQTSLVSLYTTGSNNANPDYMKYRVLSYLLGTLPNSLLFTEIREKRNLCYSIYSSLMHYEGLLSIHTGISKTQKDLVLHLIDEQIDVLKNNTFSDSLFLSAKSLLKNNFTSIEDDVSSWMGIIFSSWLLNKDFNLSNLLESIDTITRADIADAAKNLKKLCTFTVNGIE